MEAKELVKDYLEISGQKSGILMTGGRTIYLYDNLCCGAQCEYLSVKSDTCTIITEYRDDVIIIRTPSQCIVYINGKRLLKVRELLMLYNVQMSMSVLYGIFTGGNELPPSDIRYTDKRISDIFRYLLTGRQKKAMAVNKQIELLEQAISDSNVKMLSELYLNGTLIDSDTIS